MQSLAIANSNNVLVYGLSSVNSQMFHIVVNGCNNVAVVGANVVAPWNSPNTDGIHVQLSTGVTILNSKIGTGDDCISIGPGAKNLWIEGVACGPGHGIRYFLNLIIIITSCTCFVYLKKTENNLHLFFI